VRRLIIAAFLALIAGPVQSQEGPSAGFRVRVALVLEDLQVRAVPLQRLELVSAEDSAFRMPIQADLSGEISGEVPAGRYQLRSTAPARLQGVTYAWLVDVMLEAGRTTVIELTSGNATIDSTGAASASAAGRRVEDAVVTYRRVRSGVFRLEAGLGHGSGFLVDTVHGFILTNAHVVSGQVNVHVVLDSVTRVAGRVLARSEERDVAVVQVHPRVVQGRPALELADPKRTSSIVEPGERILAIGFPLHQEQTLTTGIASSLRDGAILSDVNINPGNSGGPMLNYAGVVIGINTFADVSRRAGPGVSGAVVATHAWPVIEDARLADDTVPEPPATLLPTMPLTSYPLQLLRSVADTMNSTELRSYGSRGVGPFEVSFDSPISLQLRMLAYEREIAKDRKKREQAAGLAAEERYSSIKELRQWYEYASSELTPVVGVTIQPKAGETTGSVLGRILIAAAAGAASQATYKFQGDVRGATFYRNGIRVEPLRGGHAPIEVYQENAWVKLKDVADAGYYLLPPETFRPDSLGTPPRIVLAIQDLKHPKEARCGEIDRKVTARLWNDFLPFLQTTSDTLEWAVEAGNRRDPRKYAPWGAADSVAVMIAECPSIRSAPPDIDCDLNPSFCR
jgi:S1-C subfamily serine protease